MGHNYWSPHAHGLLVHNRSSHHNEKPAPDHRRLVVYSPQLEKAWAAMKTQHSGGKKRIKLNRTWLACDVTETKGRLGMDQVPRDAGAKEHVISGQGWSRVQWQRAEKASKIVPALCMQTWAANFTPHFNMQIQHIKYSSTVPSEILEAGGCCWVEKRSFVLLAWSSCHRH